MLQKSFKFQKIINSSIFLLLVFDYSKKLKWLLALSNFRLSVLTNFLSCLFLYHFQSEELFRQSNSDESQNNPFFFSAIINKKLKWPTCLQNKRNVCNLII